jgi:chemotaxis protein methyltransferase CheR
MPPEKRIMLQARLLKRVQALNLDTFDAYLDFIFSSENGKRELTQMLDLVSTHKTSFFREDSHFSIMTDRVLPELEKTFEFNSRVPLLVWSSACSSGEEPYSIAMTLDQYRETKAAKGFDYAVLATDVSPGIVQVAKHAVYDSDLVEPVPLHYRQKYLMRSKDPERHQHRVVPELRAKVYFRELNLMDLGFTISQPVHVIFCRNVLIYFSRDRQQALARKFYQLLEPGGFLFLGHSEALVNMSIPFRTFAPTVYRKPYDAE